MSTTDPFGLIGQVLDGQFRVDKFVGEGGFSVVYRGHHVGLEEPIAIKCLKLPAALGSALVESFVKRFRDESRLHYRLSQGSLYIVRTLANGTTMAPATGALVPYMVIEWLDGRSLAADLEVRRAYGDKGRTLEETIEMLDPAVDGLAYAHANGVVHRDINPANLFLANTPQGVKLKVLDFGVAKVLSDQALALGPRAKTIGRIRIFSPQYAAPEQFDDRGGTIGPWTDVYSLALIVLEMLRDAPVMQGEHLGEFASRALDPLARPTPRRLGIAVADETEAVLSSAVSLAPRARPQDAGQFWGALKHAVRLDAEKGNVAYADPSPPSIEPAPETLEKGVPIALRKTLSIEDVPIPIRTNERANARTNEPAPEPALEMPPETARLPDAPPREEAPSLDASASPPPLAPLAQTTTVLGTARPSAATPPLAPERKLPDVRTAEPLPPVPNAFGARAASDSRLSAPPLVASTLALARSPALAPPPAPPTDPLPEPTESPTRNGEAPLDAFAARYSGPSAPPPAPPGMSAPPPAPPGMSAPPPAPPGMSAHPRSAPPPPVAARSSRPPARAPSSSPPAAVDAEHPSGRAGLSALVFVATLVLVCALAYAAYYLFVVKHV